MVAPGVEPSEIVVSEERWERVKDLLHHAMQLDPEQRARFLNESCPQGDPCRSEVDSLLAANEAAGSGFLAPPRADPLSGMDDPIGDGGLEAGDLFEGRFRLIEQLGEGGMGQVWLAEQIMPVRRQVALKLIKAGMYDPSVVQRFRSERQSLAMMDHPAIAKVFEAGATAPGQPFFVMEYVPGQSITAYCDQHRLGIRARLELLIQACEGVQHAHQKSIVHRDLKPANILVLDLDGKPAPRIIDFGLAKTTAPRPASESEFTQLGQFVGTPGYMSPEQADPNVQDIDTRTDVYSLGIVLYVLLVGCQPFAVKTGRRPPVDELLRKLREEDPPAPSAKLGGDDWIALKALERERSRRYGTPSELAADLRRYLRDEPVAARPASAGYRLRKYTRRHRIAVGVAAGLVVVSAAFTVLQGLELHRTTLERDRANQERDRANRERDRAARITDFMTSMFKVPDPSEARGNAVTAREILDKASAAIDGGLPQDAEARSQMLGVMASTYLNLGLYARAHGLAARALEARERLYGSEGPKTLESMSQLGWIFDQEGHDADAESLERSALERERRVLGPEAALTLETMDHLVVIEEAEGRNNDAEQLARQVMESAARTLGPEHDTTLSATNHFARALWYQARYAEAEQQFHKLLEIDRRVLGPDHPQSLAALVNVGLAVYAQRRLHEAEALFREVLSAQERVLGPEHQYTVLTLGNLANLLTEEGHAAEGEKMNREVLAIRLRTLGAEHPETLKAQANLANTLLTEGRVQEADRLQRDMLTVQSRVLGLQNPTTLAAQSNLASILLRERRYREAEKVASETLSAQQRIQGEGHADTLDTLRTLGKIMAYTHRYAEARDLFQGTIDRLEASQSTGTDEESRWTAWYNFACVAAAAHRMEDALQYLREAIDRGYRDVDGLLADEDLRELRHNTQFIGLIGALKTPPKQGT
jgi:serine/threonine protein kinase